MEICNITLLGYSVCSIVAWTVGPIVGIYALLLLIFTVRAIWSVFFGPPKTTTKTHDLASLRALDEERGISRRDY